MTGAARKLNNLLPKRSNSYRRVPYSALKARYPKLDKKGNQILTNDGEPVMRNPFFSELKIIGEVYAFAHMKDKPGAACERSYDDLTNRLRIARSTTRRGIKTTTQAGVIEQKKHYHKKAEYTCNGFSEKEFYITFECYLEEREFYIPRKDCTRRLSNLEVTLIALLGSLCNIPYAKSCERSVQELIREVGYCEKEIREALLNLISAGFVACFERIRYAHKRKRLKFKVNSEVRRLMIHKPQKAPKKKGGLTEQEIAADQRAEWESEYAVRRQIAVERAERHNLRARADEAYRAADDELRALTPKIAFAEIRQSSGLEALRDREKRATLIRAERLVALGILEEQLLPQWHCKKCEDTGFNIRTHRVCDCYSPPRGGGT